MKVGINILNFGPGTTPASLAGWAQVAEKLGYHLIAISDHIANTADIQTQYPAPFYDPFVTLSWLAAQVPALEIGTTVAILPYRHPLQTARMAANLDQLSGGRLILGVGVGWARQEFAALGVPFERRGALTDEYLAAITAFWTNDVASYTGKLVSFEEVHTAPRPAQSPHPPIWIAGSSDAALRRAIRFGQGWHPINIRVDWLRDTGLPRLRAIAEALDRPVPTLCPRIKLQLTDTPLPEEDRVAGQGTLDQVRADIEALAVLGAQYIVLDTYTKDRVADQGTRDQARADRDLLAALEAQQHSVPGDDSDAIRQFERGQDMLATLAERVFDLEHQTLR
jgi:probable F420-dependent oxidoreductase